MIYISSNIEQSKNIIISIDYHLNYNYIFIYTQFLDHLTAGPTTNILLSTYRLLYNLGHLVKQLVTIFRKFI